jgi:hypothetical protein
MPELSYDGSQDPDFIASLEAEQSENEQLGAEIQDAEQGLLAGKFKTAEELERGYQELQSLLGKKGSEVPEQEETEEETEDEDTEEEFDAAAVVASISQEYTENGALSQETIDELEKLSPLDVAALFLQAGVTGQAAEPAAPKALSKEETDAFITFAGGEQQYQAMIAWGRDNYAPAEVEAFNNVINSGDQNAIYFAISALQARYTQELGTDGRQITRTRPSSSRGDVFRSQAEVLRAMQDPRYESDSAYRQDVFDKLERSDLDYDG